MKRFSITALLLLATTISRAEEPTDSYERYLLPVATVHERPGGYGSIWESDVFVRNNGLDDVLIPVTWASGCTADAPETCFWIRVKSQSTMRLDEDLPDDPAFLNDTASFVYIPTSHDVDIEINARVRNLSRDDSARGTEIPVVHISDFRLEPVTLLNVVVDPGSRTLLRIFYPTELALPRWLPPPQFRIRTFDLESDTPIEDVVVGSKFSVHGPNLSGLTLQTYPGFAEWSPNSKEPRRLRAVINAVDSSVPFWGFSSTTDTVTQHVAITTPQPRRTVAP